VGGEENALHRSEEHLELVRWIAESHFNLKFFVRGRSVRDFAFKELHRKRLANVGIEALLTYYESKPCVYQRSALARIESQPQILGLEYI
jgi:hypothetical protein